MKRAMTGPRTTAMPAGTSAARRRWTRFLAAVLAILLFAFGVIPAVQRLAPVRNLCAAIQRSGIDATALFYTESDVSSEAEASIRSALTYPACGNAATQTGVTSDATGSP